MSRSVQPAPFPSAGATNHATTAADPTLRGPILLACDGPGQSSAPVIAARLLAERLGLALEIVTVLEPEAAYGVGLGGFARWIMDVRTH